MSYTALPHTADWALRVQATYLPELFAEAARGMNFLSGIRLSTGARQIRTFEARGPDDESLLVAFLSELVFAIEQDHLAFDEFAIRLAPGHIQANLAGAPIAAIEKAIKAVTYHNLAIQRTQAGFEVEIVFDV